MDLKRIKEIVNSGYPQWDDLLLMELSRYENVIPIMMNILNNERELKKEVLSEMNLLLSQSDTIINNPKLNKEGFFKGKVDEFYEKFKGVKGVFHCFKNKK